MEAVSRSEQKSVAGKPVSFGFANYLRRYVDKTYGCDLFRAIKLGGRAWDRLSEQEKRKYKTMGSDSDELVDACCRPRCCRPRRRCSVRKRCCRRPCCPRPRCCPRRCRSVGPITNNAFLNFVRSYRRTHCAESPQELLKQAARTWCSLSEEKKDRYRRQARLVTASCRHKRRCVCTCMDEKETK